MAVSSAPRHENEVHSTLARLVEAEQRWRDELAQTDRDCAARVARTSDAIERAARDLEAELATLVEQRQRELASDIERRIARERDNASVRAARLRAIDGDALEGLVQLVLSRVVWSETSR